MKHTYLNGTKENYRKKTIKGKKLNAANSSPKLKIYWVLLRLNRQIHTKLLNIPIKSVN